MVTVGTYDLARNRYRIGVNVPCLDNPKLGFGSHRAFNSTNYHQILLLQAAYINDSSSPNPEGSSPLSRVIRRAQSGGFSDFL